MNERMHSIELTDGEVEAIKKALDFYGVRMAETLGYSSGEVYWDLVNKLGKQTKRPYINARRIKKTTPQSEAI